MMEESEFQDPRDKALWDLLGRARQAEASPFFARKVLREIEAPAPVPGWVRWLRFALPAAACAVLASVVLAGAWSSSPAPMASADPALEFDTIENLDLLVTSYESNIWLNGSSSLPSF